MTELPVVDAAPLIILAAGGRFDLLSAAGERVLVPSEMRIEGSRHGFVDAAVRALHLEPWLQVVEVGPIPARIRLFDLDPGEEAVLTWALKHHGSVAILDDRRGRRAAQLLGIPAIGVLGLIAEAKIEGIISEATPVVRHVLGTTDWYISNGLLRKVLRRLGE